MSEKRSPAEMRASPLSRKQVLAQLGLPKSTYYRWSWREATYSLGDERPGARVPWNRLRPEEEEGILTLARASPELIHRRGPWRGCDDLEFATLQWVDWFNHRRLFGAIGYVPPAEYEATCYPRPIPAGAGTQ